MTEIVDCRRQKRMLHLQRLSRERDDMLARIAVSERAMATATAHISQLLVREAQFSPAESSHSKLIAGSVAGWRLRAAQAGQQKEALMVSLDDIERDIGSVSRALCSDDERIGLYRGALRRLRAERDERRADMDD
ncbi:hypothetical protein [Dyella sp.]|uniref:hypothetical protein n=1 Tax=Dyella sp. TaxID=1869338 RepID=UPI002ED02591